MKSYNYLLIAVSTIITLVADQNIFILKNATESTLHVKLALGIDIKKYVLNSLETKEIRVSSENCLSSISVKDFDKTLTPATHNRPTSPRPCSGKIITFILEDANLKILLEDNNNDSSTPVTQNLLSGSSEASF